MPYSKASFINHTKELKQGKTIIEAQPMPLFYEVSGLSRSTADVLSKQSELMEREMESQMEEGKPLSQKEQDEIDLLREIQKNYQKHLKAKITIDADVSPIVRGRNEAIRRAEKGMGIEFPYHFVWLDGAENESGIIEFPWDGYSKVYAVVGSYENPEIVFLQEAKAGNRTPKKPYFERVDGKTLVHVDGFSGAGTEQSPFEVADYTDLCKVGTGTGGWNLDCYYLQTANIQCPTGASKDNFLPIGNSTNKFTGQYDGNSKIIKDLYIYEPTKNYQGLFASAYDAKLMNIRIENVNITASQTVGSLAGRVDGSASSYTIVENCCVTGCVVGSNSLGSTGGLIGVAEKAVISNCYTHVITSGLRASGGLIGSMQIGEMRCCYAVGYVTGGSGRTGGLAGSIWGPTSKVFDCFYDSQTSGQSDTGKGTPKTTAEMQSILTYSAWDICEIEDFDVDEPTIWYIDDGEDYPRLWWEYEGGEGPITAQTPITATSSMSVTGRKIITAQAPITAKSKATVQVKKIAKAEAHIKATSALTIEHTAEEAKIGYGQADIKTYSSLLLTTKKRARSPPAEIEAETKLTAEGRKVTAQEAHISGTSKMQVACRKVAKGETTLTAGSEISVETSKTAKAQTDIKAESALTVKGKSEVHAPGEAHIKGESRLTVAGRKVVSATVELSGETKLKAETTKTAKAQVGLTADSGLTVQGRKVAQAEVSLTADSALKAEAQKTAQVEIAETATSKTTVEAKTIKQAEADLTATSQTRVTATASIPHAGQAHIKATSKTKAEGKKIAAVEADITAKSELKITGRKVVSREVKETADSKLSVQVKAVKQGQVALTATSKIEAETRGEVYDITGEAHIKATSKMAVAGRKVVLGTTDIKADSKLKVQVETIRQAQADITATGKAYVAGRYRPPYKRLEIKLGIQEREIKLGIQEREIKLGVE